MNATLTPLAEAIAEIERRRDASEFAAQLPHAASIAKDRAQAFGEVVDYLQTLNTRTADPGAST